MDDYDAPMDDAPAAVEEPAPAVAEVKPDPAVELLVAAADEVKPDEEEAAEAAAPVEAAEGGEPSDKPARDGFKWQRKSGYVHYCDLNRPAKKLILAGDTELNAVQKNQRIMSLLAADWRELSQSEKDRFKAEAPMHEVKIRKKKPKRKAEDAEKAPAPAPAPTDEQKTAAQSLDVDGLRQLKALRDEGVLTDAEFAAKKAMMLGTHAFPMEEEEGAPVEAPKAKKPKASKSAEKAPRLELPCAALEDFMDEPCQCNQENPKRKETKSWAAYEAYKGGATLRGMVDLGASKGMVAHDFARGYVRLADPARHEALWAMRKEPTKREKKDPPPPGEEGEPAKPSPAVLSMVGRYYVRRCAGKSAEEGLHEGYEGPKDYGEATGALEVGAEAASGGICMKGIADPATGLLFAPALTAKAGKAAADGTVKFKLTTADLPEGLTKAAGSLSLKPMEERDSRGEKILVGVYEFQAKRPGDLPPLDSTWEEKIRCFKMPPEGDWPSEIFEPAPAPPMETDW